jgi:hypothetical protein
MKTTRLHWFLLISFGVHALLLWQFRFVEPYQIKPVSSFKVDLATGIPPIDEVPTTPKDARRPASASKAAAATPDRRLSSPAGATARSLLEQPSKDSGETALGAPGMSSGAGQIPSDDGGIVIGGAGSAPGTGTVPPGSKGSAPAEGGTAAGKAGSSGTGRPSPADTSAVAIPDSLQVTTSPYEGEVYVRVDNYVLYGTHTRQGFNVPGNQICVEGDRLRTKKRITITETITDISKCYSRDHGDDEKVSCPPEARAKTVVFDDHPSSPVTYSFNICLLYDKSNCFWQEPGDGPERETCRAVSDYAGIWAEGTMFRYKCTKWQTQAYSHPLQYNVRFMRDIEFPGDPPRMRPRLLLSESRPISPCN